MPKQQGDDVDEFGQSGHGYKTVCPSLEGCSSHRYPFLRCGKHIEQHHVPKSQPQAAQYAHRQDLTSGSSWLFRRPRLCTGMLHQRRLPIRFPLPYPSWYAWSFPMHTASEDVAKAAKPVLHPTGLPSWHDLPYPGRHARPFRLHARVQEVAQEAKAAMLRPGGLPCREHLPYPSGHAWPF